MARDKIQTSKFLSLVLRHRPEHIGLMLDESGWADVGQLIERAAAHGVVLTRELIVEIVAGSDKQRFALDAAGGRIRANQGHSVDIDLGLEPTEPPAILFHGTAAAHCARHPQRGPEARQPPARAPVPRRGHRDQGRAAAWSPSGAARVCR